METSTDIEKVQIKQTNEEAQIRNKMNKIKKSLRSQLDGDTYQIREATVKLLEAWDKELNRIYKMLREALPEDEKIKLRNEQREWLKRREKAANNAHNNYCDENGNFCGTFASIEYNSTIVEYNEKKTLELARRYDNLNK